MKNSAKKIVLHKPGEIFRVEKFVEEICDYHNITNEHFGNIMLGVTESVEIIFSIFSVFKSLSLTVLYESIPKGLRFKVALKNIDQNTESTEDILQKEIRHHRLGRELYILRSLSDELILNQNAREITMTFYVTSINPEKSLSRIELLKNFWQIEKSAIHN